MEYRADFQSEPCALKQVHRQAAPRSIFLSACSVAPAVPSEPIVASPAVSPALPTASATASQSVPAPPSQQPGPPVANGPIYFTDGNLNRVDDGVLSVMADLVTVDVEWSAGRLPVPSRRRRPRPVPIYRSNADGTRHGRTDAGLSPCVVAGRRQHRVPARDPRQHDV